MNSINNLGEIEMKYIFLDLLTNSLFISSSTDPYRDDCVYIGEL